MHDATKHRAKRSKSSKSGDSKSSSQDASVKKILDHKLFNTHYVEYNVLLSNGRKMMATEFDFEVFKDFHGRLYIYTFRAKRSRNYWPITSIRSPTKMMIQMRVAHFDCIKFPRSIFRFCCRENHCSPLQRKEEQATVFGHVAWIPKPGVSLGDVGE